MLSQAAAHGLGVALLPMFAVEEELSEGRLVQPLNYDLIDKPYCFIVPESKATSPLIQNFRKWLVHQAKSFRAANDAAGNFFSKKSVAN
jgi:DNA-binding transcriptional LysR family regulator